MNLVVTYTGANSRRFRKSRLTGILISGGPWEGNPYLTLMPSTLKNKRKKGKEERGFSKVLAPMCKTTRYHEPGGHNPKTHCFKNQKNCMNWRYERWIWPGRGLPESSVGMDTETPRHNRADDSRIFVHSNTQPAVRLLLLHFLCFILW